MHWNMPLVAGLFVMTALAGCSDSGDTPRADGLLEEVELQAGRGAITGILVDDRFRPIHLTEEPETAFQATGFILVQETGAKVQTTEGGEFSILDLAPGLYTLRVQVDGHEASPVQVNVEEGLFAEANIVARRIISLEGTVVTQEYGIFIPCSAYATFNCPPDLSGETYRPGMFYNLSEFQNITYGIYEIAMNQPGIYCFEVREDDVGGTGGVIAEHYANWCTGEGGEYIKGIVQNGAIMDNETQRDPWDPDTDQEAILFYFGNSEATCWNGYTGGQAKRCAGAGFGIRAQVILSLFLGEPEEDLETYCLLCQQ